MHEGAVGRQVSVQHPLMSPDGYGPSRADHKMPALFGGEDTCQQGSGPDLLVLPRCRKHLVDGA
eukprot:6812510-Pyramimonas_sp.AAC.1